MVFEASMNPFSSTNTESLVSACDFYAKTFKAKGIATATAGVGQKSSTRHTPHSNRGSHWCLASRPRPDAEGITALHPGLSAGLPAASARERLQTFLSYTQPRQSCTINLDTLDPKRYLFATMATLVIKSFPEILHARLKQTAAAHRRSVTQETIHLIEMALTSELAATQAANTNQSKWANRKLLPEYEALLATGAFAGGTDSTIALSEERDAR